MITFIIWWASIGGGLAFLYTFVYHRGIKSMVDHQIMFVSDDKERAVLESNRGFFYDIFFAGMFFILSAILIYPAVVKLMRDSLYYAHREGEEKDKRRNKSEDE